MIVVCTWGEYVCTWFMWGSLLTCVYVGASHESHKSHVMSQPNTIWTKLRVQVEFGVGWRFLDPNNISRALSRSRTAHFFISNNVWTKYSFGWYLKSRKRSRTGSEQHKKILGHKNTISIWGVPNRDLHQTLFGRKSSQTGSKVMAHWHKYNYGNTEPKNNDNRGTRLYFQPPLCWKHFPRPHRRSDAPKRHSTAFLIILFQQTLPEDRRK